VRTSEEDLWLCKALEGKTPRHIGIIMDGNGRWALKKGLKRTEGHKAGVESIRRCLPALRNLGVEYCTLFVFSTENWKRPADEISFLFNLVIDYTFKYKHELLDNDVRVFPIGRWEELPQPVVNSLREVARDTRKCKSLNLCLAINYGGRQEIVDAALKLVTKSLSGDLDDPASISEEYFSSLLYTQGIPDPELIVRTSGEKRLSNFLLWQSAYSELVFTDVLWPDFGPVDLYKCVVEFSQRERRFGDVTGKEDDDGC